MKDVILSIYLSLSVYLFVHLSLSLLKLGPIQPYLTHNTHPYPYPILPLSLLKLDRNDSPTWAETTHPKNWPKRPGFVPYKRNIASYPHPPQGANSKALGRMHGPLFHVLIFSIFFCETYYRPINCLGIHHVRFPVQIIFRGYKMK